MELNQRQLSLSEINTLSVEFSAGRVTAVQDGDRVLLRCRDEKVTIHLLPYQRTREGIEQVVRANTPWPKL